MKFMKLKHIALLLSACVLGGCDFMDCDESNDYQKEDIFTSFERSKKMVTNIYSYLPHDFCNTADAMQDAATDDAVHVYKSSAIHYFVMALGRQTDWWTMYGADTILPFVLQTSI